MNDFIMFTAYNRGQGTKGISNITCIIAFKAVNIAFELSV
jgi:hypothetical protein